MIIFFILIFLISLVLESTLTTIPLVLVVLLLMAVFKKSNLVFGLAFLAGLVLDLLALRNLGYTSLFLIIFLGLVFTVWVVYTCSRKPDVKEPVEWTDFRLCHYCGHVYMDYLKRFPCLCPRCLSYHDR